MANTSRRYIDKNGKMFIPMNVEGGSWDEHFITTPKLVCIVAMIAVAILIGVSLHENYAPLKSYLYSYLIWFISCFYITRFYIFEEKFYYKMYKQMKQSEITTPAIFWDIASIKDTPNGAVLTYSDAKLGVLVRLERDTITGKPSEFKETHYDAISDFYKQIMNNRYNFVQLNIMEQAGNDPRLEELDKLIYSDQNPNIRLLMERQIGYIKNITHHTLYESDYFLFYTPDLTKIDTIVDEVIDMIYSILDGAYIGYRVMNARDIIEFVKEEYGVKYFNYTEATLTMFKSQGIHTKNPFDMYEIIYADGDIQKLNQTDVIRINRLASDVMNGAIDLNSISLKDTLYPKINQNNNKKVEFSHISEGFENVQHPIGVKPGHQRKPGGFKPPIRRQVMQTHTQADIDSAFETPSDYVDPRFQSFGQDQSQGQTQTGMEDIDDGFDLSGTDLSSGYGAPTQQNRINFNKNPVTNLNKQQDLNDDDIIDI